MLAFLHQSTSNLCYSIPFPNLHFLEGGYIPISNFLKENNFIFPWFVVVIKTKTTLEFVEYLTFDCGIFYFRRIISTWCHNEIFVLWNRIAKDMIKHEHNLKINWMLTHCLLVWGFQKSNNQTKHQLRLHPNKVWLPITASFCV